MPTLDLTQYFKTYGKQTIRVKCRAEGFRDSNIAESVVNVMPVAWYSKKGITITNILQNVSKIELYIDDELKDSIEHDVENTDNVVISLDKYSLEPTTIYDVYAKVYIGEEAFATDVVKTAEVLGVSGLYASNPSLVRTDDAEELEFVIDSSTGQISSDFDDKFPYDEMEEITIGDNVFIKIPAMAFRIGTDSNKNITDIAVARVPTGKGTWYETKEFYYGKYKGCVMDGKLLSKKTVAPSASRTIANFRGYAAANGDCYHQLDIYHKTILNFLWLIEFATKNSDAIMTGLKTGNASATTGLTDEISTPSGFLTSNKRMKWHGIEDFVGNLFEFYDGVYINYYTENPNNFSNDTTGKYQLSYTPSTAGQCIASLGWDSNHPFMCMPKEEINNSSFNTYYCDQGYAPNSSYPVCYGGASAWSNNSSGSGAFFVASNSANAAYAVLGARLLYSPE